MDRAAGAVRSIRQQAQPVQRVHCERDLRHTEEGQHKPTPGWEKALLHKNPYTHSDVKSVETERAQFKNMVKLIAKHTPDELAKTVFP